MFEILTYKKRFDANKVELVENCGHPYVVRTSSGNGQKGFIDEDEIYLNDGNTISFGQDTATMYYQEVPYFTGDKIKILKSKLSRFGKTNAQFFLATMRNSFQNFTWGSSSFNVSIIANQKVQLPLKEKSLDFSNPCDNIKNIDFDFMESFILELEEEHIRELNAYLLATGLKDYTLTPEEENALEAFKTVQWGEYRIGDLYKKLDLHNKDFDKREDTASEPTKEYSLPIVNAKHGDNGIMFYGKEDIFDSAEMTIDIVQNGAIATGDVYPQPQRTGILWDAYLIKALDHTDSKETLFFITSSIQKSIKQKFCYEFKATWDRVQRENIYLPTKNNKPDYATMETFIKAVEKLVIKDVVLYADSKIKATKNVVKKDFEYKINEDTGLLNVADSIN